MLNGISNTFDLVFHTAGRIENNSQAHRNAVTSVEVFQFLKRSILIDIEVFALKIRSRTPVFVDNGRCKRNYIGVDLDDLIVLLLDRRR